MQRDVWRHAAANQLTVSILRELNDWEKAEIMVVGLAVGLAKKAYRL